MSDGQELVAVILPRHMVAAVVNGPKMPRPRDQFMDAFEKAGKQALANPSVTVEGRVVGRAFGGPVLTVENVIPADFPQGPCTVTITPKGGQSGE